MRAKDNGKPHVCALNLFRIVRGEVAFVRSKGLDAKFIDKPSKEVATLAAADAARQLKIFEPRINVDEYNVAAALEGIGDIDNDFNLNKKEAEV